LNLIAEGEDVDDARCGLPLGYAAARDEIAVVRALLEAGAHVNADNGGYTALASAAFGDGSVEVMHVLVDAGIDVCRSGTSSRMR
jgi:ankyrin repeat protein